MSAGAQKKATDGGSDAGTELEEKIAQLLAKYEEMVEQGNKLFKGGEAARAVECYEKAIRLVDTESAAAGGVGGTAAKKPLLNTFRAQCNASAAYAKLSQWEAARRLAHRCTQLDPSFPKGWSRLGYALLQLGRFREAVNAYKAAVQRDPLNAEYKACLEEATKKKEEEESKANTAASSGSGAKSAPPPAPAPPPPTSGGGSGSATQSNAEYYYKKSTEKGAESMKGGIFQEAIRHYTKAIELAEPSEDGESTFTVPKEELATLYANRSAAYHRRGEFKPSAADAEKSVKANPQYARGYARLGAATMSLANFGASRKAYETALELDPENSMAKEGVVEARRLHAKDEKEKELRKQAELLRLKKQNEALEEEQRRRQQEEKAEKARTQTVLPTSFRQMRGVAVEYCKMCNQYGHLAQSCPLRRKRPRDD